MISAVFDGKQDIDIGIGIGAEGWAWSLGWHVMGWDGAFELVAGIEL